ncbi:TetR/AcrR family transcriptional regulator [Bacillus sp. SM2101]|uniref:TetR/AcrR family transcriptional regulator n=1 Tax=Bacillus sp. SM2101 TaxID=2805366 RepID=UPI001BDEAA4A|nr:TetR/AcrR family transcriptional regulator [Bacillus sp. SM2101]
MRKIDPKLREQMRKTYAQKLMSIIRVQGFNSLKIQDIAEHMQISKATLYNYFSSKEEILNEITVNYIEYFKQGEQTIENNQFTYIERFQKVFEQEVLTAIYISELFLEELKIGFPNLYEEIIFARRKRKTTIKYFYEQGMKEGVFHSLNPQILLMQDEVALRKLLEPTYLLEEGLTTKQALLDYYEAKKIQIIKSETLLSASDEAMTEIIEHLSRKLATSYL